MERRWFGDHAGTAEGRDVLCLQPHRRCLGYSDVSAEEEPADGCILVHV